jgi:uncharacterized protein YkwD
MLLTLVLFFTINDYSFSQILNTEEKKLYDIIMQYRKGKGLANIPLSSSLTFVAQTHVKDLQTSELVNSVCNLHSWSSNGNWTSCCYTGDHAKASCMWNKPRELTNYQGNGYEISYVVYGASVNAEEALQCWKKSSGHNAVIINKGIWADSDWKAIGVGISKNYAVVWFGKEHDNN